jgi:hypothetical protein
LGRVLGGYPWAWAGFGEVYIEGAEGFFEAEEDFSCTIARKDG